MSVLGNLLLLSTPPGSFLGPSFASETRFPMYHIQSISQLMALHVNSEERAAHIQLIIAVQPQACLVSNALAKNYKTERAF